MPNRTEKPVPDVRRMTDAELLGNFLNWRAPGAQALQQSARLLQHFGGLRQLVNGKPEQLLCHPALGHALASQLCCAREIFRRQLEESLQRGISLTSPAMTLDYLRCQLRDRSREIFTCLFLDTRHRVIASEDLFQGSIDGACVYPRVVAEKALRHGAAAVIVAHNHPSGITEPSLADQAITRRLKDALALLEIRLLDHFVIGDGEPVSMAHRGML